MRIQNQVLKLLAISTACWVTGCSNSASPAAADPDQGIALLSSSSEASPVQVSSSGTAIVEELKPSHEDSTDYSWDSTGTTQILLQGTAITVVGSGVSVSGAIATITAPGTYEVSGTLSDGHLEVSTSEDGVVQVVLKGAAINSSNTAPIQVLQAEKTVILLADGTTNSVTDGATYVFASADEDEPDAAIFSKDDLSIGGTGSLVVTAQYKDGIASKDGLVIAGGSLTIAAADDGIRGKDYLVVEGGTLTVDADGDGLKSTNDSDATKGYVSVTGGTLSITSGADGIQGETYVTVSGGTIGITSGGGSNSTVSGDASAKGLKAQHVVVAGGTLTIRSADDAIHANGTVTLDGGTFDLASGDDGVHADSSLTINGGTIDISKSYEGLESALITINDGTIHVVASDDGVNVAGGNDGSSMGGRPGQNSFTSSGTYALVINGGYLAVNADGDGLDANGSITMTGGTVLVHGPTESMNGPLDYDAGFQMTGGFLVAVGSSGMAQAPGSTSTQNALLAVFSTQSAGALVHLQDASGNSLLTFQSAKAFQSLAFCSPDLVQGSTYSLYLGGSSTGTPTDGLYSNGVYTPGTLNATFTVSGIVTNVGSSQGGGPGF